MINEANKYLRDNPEMGWNLFRFEGSMYDLIKSKSLNLVYKDTPVPKKGNFSEAVYDRLLEIFDGLFTEEAEFRIGNKVLKLSYEVPSVFDSKTNGRLSSRNCVNIKSKYFTIEEVPNIISDVCDFLDLPKSAITEFIKPEDIIMTKNSIENLNKMSRFYSENGRMPRRDVDGFGPK